jgi:hypothetical protein
MSVNFHTLCDCLEQLWIQARTAKGFSSALFPPTLRLLETLKSNSPVFARLWEEQEVKAREGGIRRFRSSNGKIVSYEQVALVPSARSDLRDIMLMPIKSKRTR